MRLILHLIHYHLSFWGMFHILWDHKGFHWGLGYDSVQVQILHNLFPVSWTCRMPQSEILPKGRDCYAILPHVWECVLGLCFFPGLFLSFYSYLCNGHNFNCTSYAACAKKPTCYSPNCLCRLFWDKSGTLGQVSKGNTVETCPGYYITNITGVIYR